MTLRNAVEHANDVVAQCPVGGTCGFRQDGGKVLWLYCGYFGGKEKSRKGLKIWCKYESQKERGQR